METSCEAVLTQRNLWISKNEWNFLPRSEIVGLIKKKRRKNRGEGNCVKCTVYRKEVRNSALTVLNYTMIRSLSGARA
jgi:hypothetical protein